MSMLWAGDAHTLKGQSQILVEEGDGSWVTGKRWRIHFFSIFILVCSQKIIKLHMCIINIRQRSSCFLVLHLITVFWVGKNEYEHHRGCSCLVTPWSAPYSLVSCLVPWTCSSQSGKHWSLKTFLPLDGTLTWSVQDPSPCTGAVLGKLKKEQQQHLQISEHTHTLTPGSASSHNRRMQCISRARVLTSNRGNH